MVILFFLRFLSFFRLSVYSLLIIQKAIFLFLRKMVFSTDCAWAVEKQPKHFCISKTPGNAGGSKKLIAMGLEKRTPFDYNKIAATNCKNNQKEVITK